jgi:hypothetical protein
MTREQKSDLYWILGGLEALADKNTKWSNADEVQGCIEKLIVRLEKVLEIKK